MKTKQGLLVLASFLLIVAWQDASAFYNPQTGRWLNRDPIAEAGGKNVHGFLANATTSAIDKDGRQFINFLRGVPTPCGGWDVVWVYDLGAVPIPVYLVQEIIVVENYNRCGRSVVHDAIVFYEAQLVSPTTPPTPIAFHDLDGWRGHPNSFGEQSVTANAKVFRRDDIPQDSSHPAAWEGVAETPHRPSTHTPPWWFTFLQSLFSDTRSTSRTWACCCDKFEGPLQHTPRL